METEKENDKGMRGGGKNLMYFKVNMDVRGGEGRMRIKKTANTGTRKTKRRYDDNDDKIK